MGSDEFSNSKTEFMLNIFEMFLNDIEDAKSVSIILVTF